MKFCLGTASVWHAVVNVIALTKALKYFALWGNPRFHFLIAQVWRRFKKLLSYFLFKSKQILFFFSLVHFRFLESWKIPVQKYHVFDKICIFTDRRAVRMDLRWAGRRGRSRLQSTSCGCLGSPWSSQRGSPWKSQFFIWNWCPGVLI